MCDMWYVVVCDVSKNGIYVFAKREMSLDELIRKLSILGRINRADQSILTE
jgi:hypothetical protein